MILTLSNWLDIAIILYSLTNSVFIARFVIKKKWNQAFALTLIQSGIILAKLFLVK